MYELAVVVDLAREVGVVFLRALEHDLSAVSVADPGLLSIPSSHPGAIAEFVRRQVDLAKTAFADEPPKSVVSDCLQISRGEFTVSGSAAALQAERAAGARKSNYLVGGRLTQATVYKNSQAAITPASAISTRNMDPGGSSVWRTSVYGEWDLAYLLPLGLNLSLGSEI